MPGSVHNLLSKIKTVHVAVLLLAVGATHGTRLVFGGSRTLGLEGALVSLENGVGVGWQVVNVKEIGVTSSEHLTRHNQ